MELSVIPITRKSHSTKSTVFPSKPFDSAGKDISASQSNCSLPDSFFSVKVPLAASTFSKTPLAPLRINLELIPLRRAVEFHG
ncbi:MAG TPA: hypothetical protein VJL54_04185 [Nitrososphaera sp.]|nr:hypothetical protein [Nitrososphaera sp.]